jgi:hypothetical protein
MSDARVTIYNNLGASPVEIIPALERVSWRLNETGEAVFSIPYEAAGPDIIKLGNRVLIEFSNGLPNWGGVIDVPLGQRDNGISVKAAQADRLLSWRYTGGTEAYIDTRGNVAGDIVTAANATHPTGLVSYEIESAGETMTLVHHYTQLLSAIRDLTDAQDYDILPVIVGGQLQLRLYWYEERGSDKSDTVLLEHGKNVTACALDWVGSLSNYITVVGGSGDWSGRTVKTSSDSDSINAYGRREKVLITSDISDATTLQAVADAYLAANKDPHVQATLTAVDRPPAEFEDYDVGDIVTLAAYLNRGNWAFQGDVRIISRQWNATDDTCTLEVKQWQS